MDPREKTQRRLLELPDAIDQESRWYLERLETRTLLESDHALLKAGIYLAGIDAGFAAEKVEEAIDPKVKKIKGRVPGAITGSNAETRAAELLILLAKDQQYSELDAKLTRAKLNLMGSELRLKNLRQEADILSTVLQSAVSLLSPVVESGPAESFSCFDAPTLEFPDQDGQEVEGQVYSVP